MIIGIMRMSYNERAVPNGGFRTICSKLCLCEGPILQEASISGGQGHTQLLRPLLLLTSVCEIAVKAGSSLKPLKLMRFKLDP